MSSDRTGLVKGDPRDLGLEICRQLAYRCLDQDRTHGAGATRRRGKHVGSSMRWH